MSHSVSIDTAKLKRFQSTKKLLKWSKEQWKDWKSCPDFGKLLTGTPFIPMKVPLSSVYEVNINSKNIFSPSGFFEKIFSRGQKGEIIDVGLVIDATGDDFYYHDKSEWEDWDAKYVKLPNFDMGKGDGSAHLGMVPSESAVKAFLREVYKFLEVERNRHIAVFSQSGYNVSAFLIISFLVEYRGIKLDHALQLMKYSTPPGIYSKKCIEMLYRKYHGTLSNPTIRISCPAPPMYDSTAKKEPELVGPAEIGPEVLTDEDKTRAAFVSTPSPTARATSSASNKRLPPPPSFPPAPKRTSPSLADLPLDMNATESSAASKSKRRKIRTWTDEVTKFPFGEPVSPDSAKHTELKSIVQRLTGFDGFVGCEAVSLSSKHICSQANPKEGLDASYFVTWRAKGRRCMLLILQEGVYALGRDGNFTRLQVHFPRKRNLKENIDQTLLDGVLVEDKDSKSVVHRYLAFDVVVFEGTPMWKNKLPKRLQCLQNEVVGPRKMDTSYDYNKDSFRFRMKDHFSISKTEYLLNRFIPKVTHRVEGLIFTPSTSPYFLGGFEYESDYPLLKFTGGSSGGIMSLDGSISKEKLIQFLSKFAK